MRLPKSIPLDREGQYCVKCFSGPVERIHKNRLTFYKCRSCRMTSERSIVIDNKITWWVDENGDYWHESVGVVVLNEDKKILCLLRKIFPFSYALPAGHLDKGEKPKIAALRELKEETSMQSTVDQLKLVETFDMSGDSCRRGSDHHKWHLYKFVSSGSQELILSDEASTTRWCDVAELKKSNNVSFALNFIIDRFGGKLVK